MKREAFVAVALLLFVAVAMPVTVTTLSTGASSKTITFKANGTDFSYIRLPKLAVVAGDSSAGRVYAGYWNSTPTDGRSILSSVAIGDYIYRGYEDGYIQKVLMVDGSIVWTILNATNSTNAITNDSSFIYTGHDGGYIQKINMTSGALIWTARHQTNDTKAMVADGAYILTGHRNGHLQRIFALNGSLASVWSSARPSTGDFVGLAQDADYLYTAHSNGHLKRALKTDGTNYMDGWTDTSYSGLNALTSDGTNLYLGLTNGTFKSINKANGAQSWSAKNTTEAVYSLAAGDYLYTGHDNGFLQKIDKSDGRGVLILQNDTNRVYSLVSNGSSVYTGQAQGHSKRVNTSNGNQLSWDEQHFDTKTINAIAQDSDYLYTGHDLGRVQKVRKSDGHRVWTVHNTTNTTYSLAVDTEYVYAGQAQGHLLKVNKTSGMAVWFVRNDTGDIYALANDSTAVYTGGPNGYYQKINKSNGVPIWGLTNNTNDIKALASDGTHIYSGHTSGWVQKLNASNGAPLWESRNSTQDISSIAVSGEYVYTGHGSGYIQKLNKSSGAVVLTLRNNTNDIKALTVDPDAIYTGHRNGYYQRYNVSGQSIWINRDAAADINALSVDGSYLYTGHAGGHIQKIRKRAFGAFFDIEPSGQDLESYCLGGWAYWCPEQHGDPINSMSTDGSNLYLALDKGYVIQMSLAGVTTWNLRTSEEDANALVDDADLVFTGHDSGYFQRVNKSSGRIDYSTRNNENGITAMANTTHFFFTGHESGYIQKVNKTSGAVNWTVVNETGHIYAMAGDSDFLYTGHQSGQIQKVNHTDGTFIWQVRNNTNDIRALALDSLAVYTGHDNGYIQKVNKSNGIPLWEVRNISHDVRSLALFGEFLYVGHSSGLMQKVNRSSGAVQDWQRPSHYTHTVKAAAKSGDNIFTGHSDGYYQRVSTGGSVIWKSRNLTADVLSAVADLSFLYIGHSNGTVLKVNITDGNVIWAAQNSTEPASALGLGGFLYSGHAGGYVQKINISNGAVIQTVSNISQNVTAMVVTPNFISTGHVGGYVQRINTTYIANSSISNVTQMYLLVNKTSRNNSNDVVSMTSDSSYRYVSYQNGYIQKFELESGDLLSGWEDFRPATTVFGLVVDASYIYAGTSRGIYRFTLAGGSSDHLNTTESYNAMHSPVVGMAEDTDFIYPVYTDGWIQKVAKAMKPVNPSIDVGNDSVSDWSFDGYFTVSQSTDDLASAINSYLRTCTPVQGYCDVPIVTRSTSAGIIRLMGLNITYTVNKTDPVFNSLALTDPASNGTQQNITAVILDDSSIDTCFFDYGLGNITMSRDGTDCQYNWTLTDTDIIRYTIYVNDSEGNWRSNTSTFDVRTSLSTFNDSQATTNVSFASAGSGQVGIRFDRYATIINATLNVTAVPDETAGQDLFCQNGWDTCMRYQGKHVYASVIDEEFVYYGSADGYIRKVNKSSGVVAWTVRNASTDVKALVNDSANIYSGHLDGYVQKIAKANGTVQWIIQNSTNHTYGIAVDASNVFTSHANGYLMKLSLEGAVDPAFGTKQYNANDTTSLVLDSTHLYTGHKEGGVQKVLKSDGSWVWSVVNNSYDVNSLGTDASFVYAGKNDSYLEKISKAGVVSWKVQNLGSNYHIYSLALDPDYIYTGHLYGYIHKQAKSDGSVPTGWSAIQNGSQTVNTLSVHGDFIYTGQDSGLTQKYNLSGIQMPDWSDRPHLTYRVLDGGIDGQHLFTIQTDGSNYYVQKYELSNGFLDPYYGISANVLTPRDPIRISVGQSFLYSCGATTQKHNKTNSSELWSVAVGCSEIEGDASHVYVGKDNRIYKLQKSDGATTWSADTNVSASGLTIPQAMNVTALALDQDYTYVGFGGGYLQKINKSEGGARWNKRYNTTQVNALVADEEFLYAGHAGGYVQKLNKTSGTLIWALRDRTNDILAIANDSSFVYAGDSQGYIYKIEKGSGTLVSGWDDFRNLTLPVSSISVGGNSLYVTHNDTGTNLQKLWKGKYPRDPTFDFLGNGTDWSYPGIYTDSARQDVLTDMQSYLSTCNKTCNVPVNLTSQSRGILRLDSLNIIYVLDTTAPHVTLVAEIDPVANTTMQNISVHSTDNVAVSLCYISYQQGNTSSGNLTMSKLGDSCWYNWTSTADGTVNYTVYVADTAYNWGNLSGSFSVHDDVRPAYQDQSQSSDTINESQTILLSVYWTDNRHLHKALLETNKTGVWVNESVLTLSGNASWSNFSMDTTGYGNRIIGWRVRVNDTFDNSNTTPVMAFYVRDILAPSISGLSVIPSLAAVNSSVTLSATISDSDNISRAYVNITHGARLENISLSASGSTYSGSYLVNESGAYNVTLVAVDRTGNVGNVTSSFSAKAPIYVNFTATNSSGKYEGLNLTVTHGSGTIYSGNTSQRVDTSMAEHESYSIRLKDDRGFQATLSMILNTSQQLAFRYEHSNSSPFTNVSGGGVHMDKAFAFEPQFTINSTVCIDYTGVPIVSHSYMKLYRRAWSFTSGFSGSWEDITDTQDTSQNLMCAYMSNYSMFSLVQKPYSGDGTCESNEPCWSTDCNVSSVARCWQNETTVTPTGGGGTVTTFIPAGVSSFNLSVPSSISASMNEAVQAEVRVGNDGDFDLYDITLTLQGISSDWYSVSPTKISLAYRESKPFTVEITPQEVGEFMLFLAVAEGNSTKNASVMLTVLSEKAGEVPEAEAEVEAEGAEVEAEEEAPEERPEEELAGDLEDAAAFLARRLGGLKAKGVDTAELDQLMAQVRSLIEAGEYDQAQAILDTIEARLSTVATEPEEGGAALPMVPAAAFIAVLVVGILFKTGKIRVPAALSPYTSKVSRAISPYTSKVSKAISPYTSKVSRTFKKAYTTLRLDEVQAKLSPHLLKLSYAKQLLLIKLHLAKPEAKVPEGLSRVEMELFATLKSSEAALHAMDPDRAETLYEKALGLYSRLEAKETPAKKYKMNIELRRVYNEVSILFQLHYAHQSLEAGNAEDASVRYTKAMGIYNDMAKTPRGDERPFAEKLNQLYKDIERSRE